ncbi:MAG: aspartyl-tRNA(Asn)/glutamyl-tRNA(Gln) amidotransferase subunit [Methylobacteriaceae bacterium]|nr:aspartyl-tRNA(Asn)/glutamyl-tRNA(Gln) amidotransferase subunit [Methylobacteriaceae bacterium]
MRSAPQEDVLEISDLPAAELAERFADRSLSPVEALRAILAAVETWEPQLHATYAFDPEGGYAAARASEARWREGRPLSAIDGVPVTVKENIASKGVPVPLGTGATVLVEAIEDAPPVARLREAGAVIFSKTTMPDYGMLSSGLSSFHPLTRNPWDLNKTPGGSSSGAGAATAAGYGPLHIGTDIGGSVRLPATWCGIFALKPSLGRIPIDPPYMGRVAGPMTRTVADAAMLMMVLAGADGRDHMSLPPAEVRWDDLDRDIKGLRIGYCPYIGCGLAVDPEVAAAVEAAVRAFEQAGAQIEALAPFVAREMLDGLDRFWRARAYSDLTKLPAPAADKVLPFISAWARQARSYSGEDVFSGYAQAIALRKATHDATRAFDFVLMPTAPVAAFAAELPCPTNDPERPFEHICFTVPFNISEQPAASINCGYTAAGLPIGLQIVGRRFDDLGVVQMARAWERMRPPQRPWPKPPAH